MSNLIDRLHPARYALIALAAIAALTEPATASPPYSSPNFNPDVSVVASTAKAGAHPDITFRMRRPPNHCQPPLLFDGVPPGAEQPIAVQLCEAAYIEQNLRDWLLRLPRGLMADLNATPVKCVEPSREGSELEYQCPAESKVGELVASDRECFVDYYPAGKRLLDTCFVNDDINGTDAEPNAFGEVFMGEPLPGEQGRVYALVGFATCYREGGKKVCRYSKQIVIGTSVKVDTTGEWRIDSTTTDMPDTALYNATADPVVFSMYETEITLFGETGAELGHPLLTNPTSCQSRSLDSTLTGYATNSYYPDGSGKGEPGQGWGQSVDDSAAYPVVGCNELAFAPELSVDLAATASESPTGLTSVLTQKQGEQTTDRVEVEVPRSFKVNLNNALEQCSAEQASARACPEGSRVGEVEAESSFLPETGSLAGPLKGYVYVGETTSDHIKLYTILQGFVEATIEGRIEIDADGTSRTFFDLPEVPQQRITLTLYGGTDKALVTTPKTCGTHLLEATFTSHQGTEARREVPVQVGCGGANFDVDVGTRRPGAHPTIVLSAASSDMGSVAFDLSRHLKVGRVARELATRGRVGTLSVSGEDGTRDLDVKLARRGTFGSLSLSATESDSQVTTLGAYDSSLSSKAKRRLKARDRTRRAKGPTHLWVRDLPPGTTRVSLELIGSRGSLIQNPERCRIRGKRLRLGFVAHVGQRHANRATLRRSVPLRCKASKRTRRR